MPINIKVRIRQETSVSEQQYLKANKATRRFLLISCFLLLFLFVFSKFINDWFSTRCRFSIFFFFFKWHCGIIVQSLNEYYLHFVIYGKLGLQNTCESLTCRLHTVQNSDCFLVLPDFTTRTQITVVCGLFFGSSLIKWRLCQAQKSLDLSFNPGNRIYILLCEPLNIFLLKYAISSSSWWSDEIHRRHESWMCQERWDGRSSPSVLPSIISERG